MAAPDYTQLANQIRVFGFARIEAVVTEDLAALADEFEAVLAPQLGSPVDERVTAFDVLRDMPTLQRLSESDTITQCCRAFYGRDFAIVASDINLLVDDSYWHSDGWFENAAFLRFVLYLEPLVGANGALRFLPGSHRPANGWQGEPVRAVMQHEPALGLEGWELPAVTVNSQPGDLIVFDTNTLHSAWHGRLRRQLAFNVAGEPLDAAERSDRARYFLSRYVSTGVRFS